MLKAVFLDFYGTVVHEDGDVINKITRIIMSTGQAGDRSQIGAFWWKEFQSLYINSYGDTFETQRELEYRSLKRTLQEFGSDADAGELSNMMFEHWVKPPIFEEAREFFEKCPVPVYIVSNIDKKDIQCALEYHRLKPEGVFTSEDARSYKPREELFRLALHTTGLDAGEVVHIGDSLTSDVKGAGALGIHALWLNRSGRDVPEGVISIENLLEAYGTSFFCSSTMSSPAASN